MTATRSLFVVTCAAMLAACAAGPNYQRPVVDMPVAWKIEPPWREGAPNDLADKGPWWLRFGDPLLDTFEQQALAANPTLAAADARLTQARAQLASATTSLYPQVNVAARAGRQAISAESTADQLRSTEPLDRTG